MYSSCEKPEAKGQILLALLLAAQVVACGDGERAIPKDRDGPTVAPQVDTLVMQVGGQLSRRPEAPLRIEGACPFECCAYGGWTTTGATTVYAEPAAAALLTVPAGTPLAASSGFVLLTRIGMAVALDTVRMYGESGASRLAASGDTLLVLDNVGEGFRRVWHEGGIYQTDAVSGIGASPPVEILQEPEEQWWARVRTADGRAGWLWMDRTPRMEGADACS